MSANTQNAILLSETKSLQRHFRWTISNFAQIYQSTELIDKQAFSFELGWDIGLPTKWSCYIRRLPVEDRQWIGIYLQLEDYPPEEKEIWASFAFKMANMEEGHTVQWKGYQDFVGVANNSWGWNQFLPDNVDLSLLPLTEDGGLPVEVMVTLFYSGQNEKYKKLEEVDDDPVQALIAEYEERFMVKLQSDVGKMLNATGKPVMTKVNLVSGDDKHFQVNGAVLCARSAVFQQLIEKQMTEEDKAMELKMDPLSAKSLDIFLYFLSTGSLKKDWDKPEVVEQLTEASNKFGVVDLKEFLDKALGLVCNVDNCGRLLRLAKMLEMKNAEKALLDYAKKHIFLEGDSNKLIKFATDATTGERIKEVKQGKPGVFQLMTNSAQALKRKLVGGSQKQ